MSSDLRTYSNIEVLLSPLLISFWLSAYKYSLSLWLFDSVGDLSDFWDNQRAWFNSLWLIQGFIITSSGCNSHLCDGWDFALASWCTQSRRGNRKRLRHLLYINGHNTYCTSSHPCFRSLLKYIFPVFMEILEYIVPYIHLCMCAKCKCILLIA